MNYEDFIENNSIIICENNFKETILKNFYNEKKFFNIKFYTKKEFLNNYFFTYDEKAIYYLNTKYNYQIEIAKIYLNNLYYINDNNYNNFKLDELKKIKDDLDNNNLLIYNSNFKKFIKDKKIIVLGYPYLDNNEIEIFNKLNAKIISYESKYELNNVYEFKTGYDQIIYITYEICKLLKKGININNIKLINVLKEDFNYIKRIFKMHNLNINFDNKVSLYSLGIIKKYLNDIDNIDIILDEEIKNKVIDIINKYYFIEDKDKLKEFLIYEFKNTFIKRNNNTNSIEIIDLFTNYSDDNYYFLLNFNMGIIPMVLKDEDYIDNNMRKILNLKDLDIINKEINNSTINVLKSIKNLTITYKLNYIKETYYPSLFVNYLNLNIKKVNIDILNSYSKLFLKIDYANLLDIYNKYGVYNNLIDIYKNTFGNIRYNDFNNKYKLIDLDLLNNYLNNKLLLSYTSMNNYYKCSFRYYLANILKIDIFNETFDTFIGSLYHDVLEKCLDNDNNIDDEINNYLNKKNRVLNSKEKFFINKLKKDMEFTLNEIKIQDKYTTFDKSLFEKELPVELSDNVSFTGKIDKILYKEYEDKTLVSVIDYKTGTPKISLENLEYGIDMQLPIYLYLIKNYNLFNNPYFVGMYLQYILDKNLKNELNKDIEEIKKSNLKLRGYTVDNINYLKYFDNTYENSKYISGLKLTKDGNFYKNSKVLSEEEINNIINLVEEKINEAYHNILNGKFEINPKKDIKNNDIGCKYCKFNNICFKKEEDYKILDNLSFEGGQDE